MPAFPFDIVAFDLDGTLADTSPDIAAALNRTLDRLGRPGVGPETARRLIGGGARSLLRKALATSGASDEALVERAFPIYLDCYAANICGGTLLYPGVEQAMDALAARGIALSICTNKPERLTSLLVEALGWQGRFASLISADTVAARKPDPLPLREAIARAGGGRAAFVGDSIIDAETAQAASVPFVAVSFGFSDRPVEELGADLVIDDYGELVAGLERL